MGSEETNVIFFILCIERAQPLVLSITVLTNVDVICFIYRWLDGEGKVLCNYKLKGGTSNDAKTVGLAVIH